MTIELKDGTAVDDVRLDRLIQFDERSRSFPIDALVYGKKPRSNSWRIQTPFLIDQGREGACVGFAITNELHARPSEVSFGDKSTTDRFAVEQIYYKAQEADPWAGGAYPGATPRIHGTSVLAGLQVVKDLGYCKEFRWSFGYRDLVLGLGGGPGILGIVWHDTNYTPDSNGYIAPVGNVVGGHAILARGVKLVWLQGFSWDVHGWNALDLDSSYVILRNSWGVWGHNGSGDCFVTLRNMAAWLDNNGEAAFLVDRRTLVSK